MKHLSTVSSPESSSLLVGVCSLSVENGMQRLEIPMIASTDAGIPGVYHEDLPDALAVFAQIAELSPEQALKSATSTSANALGISVSTGSLENGKFADLLIVDGDPLQDLSAIKSIFKVYASGRDVMRLS